MSTLSIYHEMMVKVQCHNLCGKFDNMSQTGEVYLHHTPLLAAMVQVQDYRFCKYTPKVVPKITGIKSK